MSNCEICEHERDSNTEYCGCCDGRNYKEAGWHIKKRLTKEIKQLQAELDKHRWIPVTERLPEDGLYLTKYKGDGRQQLNEKVWIRVYPFGGIFTDNWVASAHS